MGDLRNKLQKQIRDAKQEAWIKSQRKPDPPPVRCQCGNTYYDTNLYSWSPDRWTPCRLYCFACMPYDAMQELMECWISGGIKPHEEIL